jgi:hypothetical protein
VNFSEQVKAVTGAVNPDVMARAAAFLLLSDSRASFHIEGEKPAAASIGFGFAYVHPLNDGK